MIRKRNTRRVLGITLVVIGAILMWAASSPVWGGLVFLTAIVIEAIGIHLEHRQGEG
ncbi:MAG: hypothetical protein ACKVQT_34975 [Burkholderiales bacterium]